MSRNDRNATVVIRFADAESKQAARIAQVRVLTVLVPTDVLDEIDERFDVVINGEPTVVPEPEWPVCLLCGDYIHQSSDAFPDDDRWYDSSGDPTCIASLILGARAPGAPAMYGPHVFDGKTRPADDDGEYPKGGADDAPQA